jgi:hypothetical protein
MDLGIEIKRTEGARVRLEKKIVSQQSSVQAAVQNFEDPEEIIKVIETGAPAEPSPVEVEEEKPEPKPTAKKKPAPKKPKASGS